MDTLRGKISYWAFMILGIVGVGFQMYKYITNQLELSLAEFGFTILCGVLVFAPKALSKTFGRIVDNRLNK